MSKDIIKQPTARILVSIPEDLLEDVDIRAEGLRMNRSEYLRYLVRKDLRYV